MATTPINPIYAKIRIERLFMIAFLSIYSIGDPIAPAYRIRAEVFEPLEYKAGNCSNNFYGVQ
jgi:hypothetical protein